jgi:ABC-type bacteriocin/lantibiotic exporter with double-glycine peptidase domain
VRTKAGALALLPLAAALAADGSGIWLDVPFVRQVENGCGSAALSMTLQYWMRHGASLEPADADAAQIQSRLYSASARGITASSLQGYLEMHGFRVVVFHGAWADLREQLSKGRPLIVAIQTAADSLHYAVVAGLSEQTLELNDPADRKLRKVGRAEFEKKWRATENWTLLAVPRAAS